MLPLPTTTWQYATGGTSTRSKIQTDDSEKANTNVLSNVVVESGNENANVRGYVFSVLSSSEIGGGVAVVGALVLEVVQE